MKTLSLFAGIALALAFTYGCSSDDNNNGGGGGDSSDSGNSTPSNAVYGTPVNYGGETYQTVVIGSQIWMARNLNYAVKGSRCYGEDGVVDNDEYKYNHEAQRDIILSPTEIQANCAKYGRLYDWATAMDIDKEYNDKLWDGSDVKHQGICPDGWYLPSNADWDKLYRYVDGTNGARSPYDSPTAGKYLKATSGWNTGSGYKAGTDNYGFAALPGGWDWDRYYRNVGYFGYWWSSSEDTELVVRNERFGAAYSRNMYYDNDGASNFASYSSKSVLISVRCVQDNTGYSSSPSGGSSSSRLGSSSSSSRPGSSSSGGGSNSSSSSGGGNSSNSQQSGVVYGTPVNYGNETYQTVVIGSQTWMAMNLNYDVPGNDTDVCYDNDPANCATYGRLYNWATAMNLPSSCNEISCSSQITAKHQGICPTGWHIPSNADWNALMTAVGGYQTAGTKLKATSGWITYSGNGEDKFGFAALPGGYISNGTSFEGVGYLGYWLSASENNAKEAHYRVMVSMDDFVDPDTGDKSLYLVSVRCLKD